MRREHARIAVISSLATLLLGCASTPATTPATAVRGKTAAVAPSSPKTANAPREAQSPPAASTNLEEQIQAAVALRIHGDTAQATRALAQLVLVAPDDPRVLGEYGKALVQQNRADDAVAFLKRAVEIKANDWTLYSALGVAYDQLDDRKNAKTAYDRALLLHPGDPVVLNNYAVSRMLAKDYDSAQRLLMQARAAGGDLPKISGNLQLLAQLRAAKAQPAIGAKATTAASEPHTSVPATTAKLPDSGTAPVVVMQRIPSDTPVQSTPAMRGNPVSPDRAARTEPRAITPNVAAIQSNPVRDQEAKSAAMPVAPKRTRAASVQKVKAGSKTIASMERKKPVTAEKEKMPDLPALRTDD